MAEVEDEIWALLAKYLSGEVTPAERVMVELLLSEHTSLNDFYQKIQTSYSNEAVKDHKNAIIAFEKLDKRIRRSEPHKK